jgi:hypothetical protein
MGSTITDNEEERRKGAKTKRDGSVISGNSTIAKKEKLVGGGAGDKKLTDVPEESGFRRSPTSQRQEWSRVAESAQDGIIVAFALVWQLHQSATLLRLSWLGRNWGAGCGRVAIGGLIVACLS